ncbi:heat shock 70 kDa protein 16 [Lactuca sativa]|uniref:heat shock 70 kDa protein 16 n=1 Tax=Lactuca sativa TaxID=4236 RepID=UPI000CD8AF22|nr:heat shock 70 kDa protein 16 [Lactuca sativa]
MSVVGFDIGNENCAIAVAKRSGIDMLLNDESKRETPAVVSFGEKQRFLGSSGAAFATKYPKSTISQIKRLIGRKYKEPSMQEELKLLPFETTEGPHGGVLIHLQYLDKTWTFTPVDILGMLFAHLKQMTEKNLESPVIDCVIGIPSYFTDLQRREYLHAASIAGLRPLQLVHDCTAVALGYGMFKTDFLKKGPTIVLFLDIGQCDTQVTVAAFEKGKMEILAHSFDPNLGGRDFDEVLFSHFATQFKQQYGIDVYTNVRASMRLRTACEKLKKVLSANAEAPLSIECLVDDKDLVGFITREEFEKLSAKLLQRVSDVCQKAIKDSGLSADKIHSIEVVGSGSRIPAIMRKLTSVFDKEPMRTLNGSECVARGCALSCAMLSPTCRVKDYKVKDIFPYSVGLRFDDGENKRHPELKPFPKGSPFPTNKTVPYHGNITFCCEVFYTNKMDFPSGISPLVGRFRISPHLTSGEKSVKATVNVQLNAHGIFEIKSVSFLEVLHPLFDYSKLYSLMMMYANNLMKNGAAGYNTTGSTLRNAHSAVEPRSRAREQKLLVSENYHVMTTIDEIHKAQKRAEMFADQDIKVEKTKEKRNTLESFIYDTRSKLFSSFRSLATDSEVEIISKRLQKTLEWLYEEGDDESEQVYIRKLEHLEKYLDPIENRYTDEKVRQEATRALQTCIKKNRLAADQLPPSQKEEVNNACIQAEWWLNQLSHLQDSLPKNATRIYCLSSISGITQAFKRQFK